MKRLITTLLLSLLLVTTGYCAEGDPVLVTTTTQTVYVATTGTDDDGCGSATNQCATISYMISEINNKHWAVAGADIVINVADGTYTTSNIVLEFPPISSITIIADSATGLTSLGAITGAGPGAGGYSGYDYIVVVGSFDTATPTGSMIEITGSVSNNLNYSVYDIVEGGGNSTIYFREALGDNSDATGTAKRLNESANVIFDGGAGTCFTVSRGQIEFEGVRFESDALKVIIGPAEVIFDDCYFYDGEGLYVTSGMVTMDSCNAQWVDWFISGLMANLPYNIDFTGGSYRASTGSTTFCLIGSMSRVYVDSIEIVDFDYGFYAEHGGMYFLEDITYTGITVEILATQNGIIFNGRSSPNEIYMGGSIGIGTTSPTNLLEVSGAAGSPGTIGVVTEELTVVDGDELGRINFQAPLESSGTDAILVGASIWAEAEDTFDASTNETALVFSTSESGTPTEQMRIDSGGAVGVGVDTPSEYVNANMVVGSSSGGSLSVVRTGTPFSGSTVGQISFEGSDNGTAPGRAAKILCSASQNWTDGNNGARIDIQTTPNNTDSLVTAMRIANTGNVGIGVTAPDVALEVAGIILTTPASSRTCDADAEGGIMYDSDTNFFYGCDGSSWNKFDN
ncbi:MAG: hypothetical protein GY757_18810 [bacterium]|nr:hypothetical protein [bacterium]